MDLISNFFHFLVLDLFLYQPTLSILFHFRYPFGETKQTCSAPLQPNTNMKNYSHPPYRSSDQLTRKLSPADRKISPSYIRSSRSPSRTEVDEAIATLRSPSPGPASSELFGGGTRSRLSYYKSPVSPTNVDNLDIGRRSMSPPSRSPSRISTSSYTQKLTHFPSKLKFNQLQNETNPNKESIV